MSASSASRQPKGTPTGGQFATTDRPESSLSLDWRHDAEELPRVPEGAVQVVRQRDLVMLNASDWERVQDIVRTARDGTPMTDPQRAFISRLKSQEWVTEEWHDQPDETR